MISDIMNIYDDYFRKADNIPAKQKLFGGLFGLSKKPSDNACHEEFSGQLKAALDIAAGECSSAELREILGYIFEMPVKHETSADVYWTLTAVQTHTVAAAEKLMPEDAELLAESYDRYYPASRRLPAQNKVYEALKARADDR